MFLRLLNILSDFMEIKEKKIKHRPISDDSMA